MATDYTNSTYQETIFDADDYEAESTGGSSTRTTQTKESKYDDAFKRYVPPHRRGVNLEMGDHVQVAGLREEDKQGVDNHAFQKLIVYVSFALVHEMVAQLAKAFPGMFFVSKCHDNHDHPFSHVVTQVGTRLLQRMFVPGSRILDVYGSPLACQKFNHSQKAARNPKTMFANVIQTGGTNFIREVNKWGPIFGGEDGINFTRGPVARLTDGFLKRFDCFQLIHTLYYVTNEQLVHLLHSPIDAALPGLSIRKKALALIHVHTAQKGSINNGEQTYEVRNGIVKQKNVSTNSSYLHPNITPFWMAEKKEWYNEDGIGFVWELHTVCKDTWIVEIVAATRQEIDDTVFEDDWEAMFDEGLFDHSETTKPFSRRAEQHVSMLPTVNGKFIELDLNNDDLVTALRRFAAGKPRAGVQGHELMKELIGHARNLVHPSSLFPDKTPLACRDGTMVDHCVSAFLSDLERETSLLDCMDNMQGLFYKHSKAVTGKRPAATAGGADWLGNLRLLAKVGTVGIKAARSKDPVGSALSHVEGFLS